MYSMVISVTFSGLTDENALERPYKKIKVKAVNSSDSLSYFAECFTQTQVFHKKMSVSEIEEFINTHAGTTFKNAVVRTENEETVIQCNKKGKINKSTRKLKDDSTSSNSIKSPALAIIKNKEKNYLIQEGKPVPFMVLLGVMTPEGKIISSRYDKFKQINRFLEFINDIIPAVQKQLPENQILRIADFGCGKSYLTFAVHYYLTQIKKIKTEIIGLDLKKEVIDYCNKIARELNCSGLKFDTGNIENYTYENKPDIVITLHACDTATDFALDYAIKNDVKAILSVPCCQHEINKALDENIKEWKKTQYPEEFAPLLKYGIIKEKFASLLTDSLRAEKLEQKGYSVQLLEFIDMEHTPKNLLIRAIKKTEKKNADIKAESPKIEEILSFTTTLDKLLK